MMKRTHFSDLPEDLVMEILSRLPVKSLLQLKCVSKNWYVLIENPVFIQKHLHHINNPTSYFVHHYFLDTMKSGFTLFNEQNQLVAKSHLYQDVLNTSTHLWEVLGPLNGLFLLYNDQEEVALWNPATKEFKPLPISQPLNCPSFSLSSYKFGFGIEPSSGDYKVVWMRDYWDVYSEDWHLPTIISVYTLSTNSWKNFEEFSVSSRDMVKSSGNTYLNGFYYWRARQNDKIFAFDMSNDTIVEIQTPKSFTSKQWDLSLFNDFIAMYIYEPISVGRETCIDIWIMEKEGYWAKKARIGPFLNIKRSLGYGNNGEVFLEVVTWQLDIFDPCLKKNRVLGHQRNGYSLQAFAYKESLVSLKKNPFVI
ncbi:putative F-box protein At2g02030 [Lycium ferocissimum]|uniref:putative F-box protein At2g02030 n=1 Tax=Lycium ferocissimum TaxID=112874 RepID=UPI002814C8C8|nr:putative F-box protein At2g02030 [Lycium ferocissimum]